MGVKIILKSGHIFENVRCLDSTKSVIGLWIWSRKQVIDQVLSFDGLSILSSDIAAIEGIEENNSYSISDKDFPLGGNNNGKF